MTTPNLRDRARQGQQRQPTTAVAARDDRPSPRELVQSDAYRREFAATLPSHVDVDSFVTAAQGALKKSDKLQQAATRSPGSFFQALREAARLGHVPGSNEYYLTIRGGEVLGVEGYRGVIERIYRAGAASSVIVEPVYEHDTFDWRPGEMDRPHHRANWFGDRGALLGAYAYAIMRDGATSKVVIADPERIARAKAASAAGDNGPWRTDTRAMVLKTAAHDLEKWVPTSAEFRTAELKAQAQAAREDDERRTIDAAPQPEPVDVAAHVVDAQPLPADPTTGEMPPDDEWPAAAAIPVDPTPDGNDAA